MKGGEKWIVGTFWRRNCNCICTNSKKNTTFHFISTRLLSSEGGNGGGGGSGTNKRKVEVLSEPMAFEDVDDITSLRQEDSKRDRIIA